MVTFVKMLSTFRQHYYSEEKTPVHRTAGSLNENKRKNDVDHQHNTQSQQRGANHVVSITLESVYCGVVSRGENWRDVTWREVSARKKKKFADLTFNIQVKEMHFIILKSKRKTDYEVTIDVEVLWRRFMLQDSV